MYHAYREASRNPQKEHLASAARAASHIPSLSFTFLIISVLAPLIIAVLVSPSSLFSFSCRP